MKIGKLRQDDSCHWYLVPDDKVKRFDEIMQKMENLDDMSDEFSDYEDEFINCYVQYMLGGGIHKLDVIMTP